MLSFYDSLPDLLRNETKMKILKVKWVSVFFFVTQAQSIHRCVLELNILKWNSASFLLLSPLLPISSKHMTKFYLYYFLNISQASPFCHYYQTSLFLAVIVIAHPFLHRSSLLLFLYTNLMSPSTWSSLVAPIAYSV